MSNLIKAYTISYPQEVRTIDFNARASAIEQEFIDQYISGEAQQVDFAEVGKILEEERVVTAEDVDFKPGLTGPTVVEEEYVVDRLAELDDRIKAKELELQAAEIRVQEAQAEADRIVDGARSEMARMIQEATEQAEAKKSEILEAAATEGYNAGIERSKTEAEEMRTQVEAERQANIAEYEKQVSELEPAFVEVVIKCVKKLTGIYEEDKKDIILYLIESALKNQPKCSSYLIRVSEQDYPVVSYSKDLIRRCIDESSSLEIISDKLMSRTQCQIETENRIFDCSLDTQLIELIEDLKLLAEKE